MDLRIPWNCKMDSILKEKYSRIQFEFSLSYSSFLSFFWRKWKERDEFKNSLELQDGFDSERKILSNTYNSIVGFFILHFFISFGGRRRERGGFKNSLELQDGFDSERKIFSNTYNSIVEFPYRLFFISSFLLEEVEGKGREEDLRIPWNCKMDSILKKKIFSNTYNSIVEFFILHFFISFGEGERRRDRGGFKNSLELQDGFDSKKNLKYVQFNHRISFLPFSSNSSFLHFFWRRWKKKGEGRI